MKDTIRIKPKSWLFILLFSHIYRLILDKIIFIELKLGIFNADYQLIDKWNKGIVKNKVCLICDLENFYKRSYKYLHDFENRNVARNVDLVDSQEVVTSKAWSHWFQYLFVFAAIYNTRRHVFESQILQLNFLKFHAKLVKVRLRNDMNEVCAW